MKPEETSHSSIQSEELFRLVAENVDDFAIFAIDLDGNVASWNPGVEKLLGYDERDFIGRDACDIFTPEDNARDACAHELRTAKEQGRAEDRRWHLRKDGSRLWANGLMMALRDDAGQLRGFAKIMRDETARKHAEDERERFFALGSDLLAVAGFDGYFKWVSPAWERAFGWTAEELTAHQWLHFTHSEDQERTVAEAQKLFRGQETVAFENRYRCKDGSYRWLSWRAKPYPEEQLLYCAAIDITERKETEEALRVSERQFRTLSDSIPQLAWMADAEGYIFWYNRRWYDYTGTTLEEMQGWGWQKVHDPEEVERVTERFKRHVASGEPWEDTFPLRSKEGEYRRFLSRALPVRDAAGSVVRWFGTNTDIEEQSRTQEELKEANRLKDEFLSTLSHELRTPLTAILGWSNMLRDGRLDESSAARALETVQRNARAQVQLIDDLLDVSRIITGKLRLDVRPLELSQVIEAAVDSVRPAAEAKNIRLQVLLDPQAGPVSGDGDRLQQVVWNLLTNAVKFTPKGGRVQVRLERIDSHVELTVSDTGLGIEPEFLPHVFDRFRQADQTTTRSHGGLGLGLTIVRQLVESHGGTVHAESEGEGKGATFVVQLPVMIARRQPETPERRHPKAGGGGPLECPPPLAGLRVLVIDDEGDARELLRAVLEQCGSEVTLAASVSEAVERFKQSKPDVLVSDIGMPGADGYELIREVRALEVKEGSGRTPAVALTAYARVEDRVRALNAGYQVHVPKPVEPAELVAVVASLAGRTGII